MDPEGDTHGNRRVRDEDVSGRGTWTGTRTRDVTRFGNTNGRGSTRDEEVQEHRGSYDAPITTTRDIRLVSPLVPTRL